MDIQIPSSLERLIYDLENDSASFYTNLKKDNIGEKIDKRARKFLNQSNLDLISNIGKNAKSASRELAKLSY